METHPRGWVRARRLPGVAGRIRDDDIAEVREKARIDDVVSQYVTLKRAGGGSLKGLCPFHDEKTPSFNVNPARQFFHCFGCGEGGDAIAFVMKVDGLTFTEVPHISGDADMVGIIGALVTEERRRAREGGPRLPIRPDHGQQMLDDQTRTTNPGYSLIGRMKGLAEIRGVELAVTRLTTDPNAADPEAAR